MAGYVLILTENKFMSTNTRLISIWHGTLQTSLLGHIVPVKYCGPNYMKIFYRMPYEVNRLRPVNRPKEIIGVRVL